MKHPEAVRWSADRRAVELLDQTRLPEAEKVLRLDSAAAVAESIRMLRVRGAPAIGIAAAMGVAVEAERHASKPPEALRQAVGAAIDLLRGTRPTAVNLFWALERMRRRMELLGDAANAEVARALAAEATAILEEDRAMCRRIGEHGLGLLPPRATSVLTHCNAGALATGGMGTALAPLYLAHDRGMALRVYADETRPLLQGSRLTAWELGRAGIHVTLVADSVAGFLMQRGEIDVVMVGADRIAANGDVANKIGTYGLAVLAAHHGVPFYVLAPVTTIDPATPSGGEVVIEERGPDEVRRGFGRVTAPADVPVYAPAFDITPAALITAIVTDRGVLRPPFAESIRRVLDTERAEPVDRTE